MIIKRYFTYINVAREQRVYGVLSKGNLQVSSFFRYSLKYAQQRHSFTFSFTNIHLPTPFNFRLLLFRSCSFNI